MPFTPLIKWLKDIKDTVDDVLEGTRELKENEGEYRKRLVDVEHMLADLTDIPMSDEDVELVVGIQMKANPHRQKTDAAIEKLYEVLNNG